MHADDRDKAGLPLKGGVEAAHSPVAIVQTLQRTIGNRAVATALRGGDSTLAVQRAGMSGVLDKMFGAKPKQETLEEIALNPTAWKHFRAFSAKEFSSENCIFFEEYMRAKTRGGGGDNQRLYDIVMNTGDGELNITEKQRAEVKAKAGPLFWDRPLSLFDPVLATVKTNLSDTFSRFQNHPRGKAAAKALTAGESWRTKIGRFLGEKDSKKSDWIRSAEKAKFSNQEEQDVND